MRRFDPETHPVHAALVAPFSKIAEMPFWARVWGILAGTIQTVWEDAFTGILILAVFSGLFDYYWGRTLHRRRGTFDPLKAELGMHSKIAGLVLVLLVRGGELWLGTIQVYGQPVLQTHGFAAAALAFGIFVKDLDSIYAKRSLMGGGDLPVLPEILRWMRAIPERLFRPPQEWVEPRPDHEEEEPDEVTTS